MEGKKGASIPEWQKERTQGPGRGNDAGSTLPIVDSDASLSTSDNDLLEQAKEFLDEESIKHASHDRKVTFLQKKGLKDGDIQKLLGPEPDATPSSEPQGELKTVHDSNTSPSPTQVSEEPTTVKPVAASSLSSSPQTKRDVPPVITYPEFLLKPQKPPPLVTFNRLANAAYIAAGVSVLTYGASKYLIQPMLESLTDARHDLASGALQELEKMNTKLESTVSHVPYIASSGVLKRMSNNESREEDAESIDSDPTELFHRDIATQTSPAISRSSSSSSIVDSAARDQNATSYQSKSLSSLHASLSSLLSSTKTTYSTDQLKEAITDLQAVVDKVESNHNLVLTDFSSIYSSAHHDKAKKAGTSDTEAAKFKAEIRSLKGAFLSSRNFPTARPTTGFGV